MEFSILPAQLHKIMDSDDCPNPQLDDSSERNFGPVITLEPLKRILDSGQECLLCLM
jgi:hypothetical protein